MKIIIGRVTKDLESQTSSNGITYLNFDVAENIGYGEKAKTIYHRCTIFGEELVNRIARAGVKKGSLLKVVGEQTLDAYVRESDKKAVPTSSIDVWHWDYVQVGKPGGSDNTTTDPEPDSAPTEDCDDGLPE